jgi:arylsulfatase A-like enzyme
MNTVMKMSATWITATLMLTLGMARADAAETRPNIIFIFADDWGWGDLSCHGNTSLKTPNLDKLASQGTDFQQFNVLNPVCSPSRAAVMTGMYPARFSVHQHFATPAQNHERGMPDWLDPKAPSLPRFLNHAGYRTAHFGKWHLTNGDTEGAPKPEAYGYDEARVFNGLEDNTIVMFSSDNGPEYNVGNDSPQKNHPDAQATGYGTYYSVGETGGMRGRKRSLFEGGVRVPFIVRWPGHTVAGTQNRTTVLTAVDILPTLCAAAGVTLPADYRSDGEDLLAVFNGKPTTRTRPHLLAMARLEGRSRLLATPGRA